MAVEMKGRVVVGEGKTVEVDDGYFGGNIKPATATRYSQTVHDKGVPMPMPGIALTRKA